MQKGREQKRFAKKWLGQNFLVDPGFVSRIVDAVGLSSEAKVLEIGPGRGALTGALLATLMRSAMAVPADVAAIRARVISVFMFVSSVFNVRRSLDWRLCKLHNPRLLEDFWRNAS